MKAIIVQEFNTIEELQAEVARLSKLDEQRIVDLRAKYGNELGLAISALAQMMLLMRFTGAPPPLADQYAGCNVQVVDALALGFKLEPRAMHDLVMEVAESRDFHFRVRNPNAPKPDPSTFN